MSLVIGIWLLAATSLAQEPATTQCCRDQGLALIVRDVVRAQSDLQKGKAPNSRMYALRNQLNATQKSAGGWSQDSKNALRALTAAVKQIKDHKTIEAFQSDWSSVIRPLDVILVNEESGDSQILTHDCSGRLWIQYADKSEKNPYGTCDQ